MIIASVRWAQPGESVTNVWVAIREECVGNNVYLFGRANIRKRRVKV